MRTGYQILEILGTEITVLNDLIACETNDQVREELIQERMALVAKINNRLGTDHIAKGSIITPINND